MIISYKYNFIFIKTQKTAGTSLEICLSKYMGPKDVITPVSPPDEIIRKNIGGKAPQNLDDISLLPKIKAIWRYLNRNKNVFNSHMSLEQMSKLKLNISDFEIVTISRNPWEVNASLYFYEKHKRPKTVYATFNEWVLSNCISNFDKLKLNGKYLADTVFLYDHLYDDYSNWAMKIGLPHEAVDLLREINAKSGIRPKGIDYFAIYDDDAKKMVENKNIYEINEYNYKFNN